MTRSDARLSSRGQCDAVGGALLPRSLNKPGRRRTPAAWLRTTCADIRAGKPVARCSCYQVSAIRQSESRGHRGPANRTLSGFLPCSASNGVGTIATPSLLLAPAALAGTALDFALTPPVRLGLVLACAILHVYVIFRKIRFFVVHISHLGIRKAQELNLLRRCRA